MAFRASQHSLIAITDTALPNILHSQHVYVEACYLLYPFLISLSFSFCEIWACEEHNSLPCRVKRNDSSFGYTVAIYYNMQIFKLKQAHLLNVWRMSEMLIF